MNELREKIHSESWDNAIFLDACRYDFFKQFYSIYPNIEKGSLECVKAPGSATPESVPKLFDEKNDWYLFSAHNWLGKDVEPLSPLNSEKESWHATEHFTKIKKITETNSDGVVGPKILGNKVIENINEINRNKTVVWAMQPHQPYTGNVSVSFGKFFPWNIFIEDGEVNKTLEKLVRTAYKFNLLSILYTVSNIVGVLDGTTVITSDHGELLFDDDKSLDGFAHPHSRNDDKLRNVPYLTVNSDKSINQLAISDREYVKLVYQSVLNRKVKKEGLNRYTEALKSNNENMGRQSLILTLLHSNEYENNITDPNSICGIKTYEPKSNGHKTDLGLDEHTNQQLDALGYK